jgi:hypothetical protein
MALDDMQRRLSWGAAALVLLGIVAGAWLLSPPPTGTLVGALPAWRLPQFPDKGLRYADSDLIQISRRAPFGHLSSAMNADGTAGSAAAAQTTRLLAIIASPQPQALIIQDGQTHVRRYSVGGKLDNGAVLTRIEPTQIELSAGACHLTVFLFGRHDANIIPTPLCGGTPGAPAKANSAMPGESHR